MAIQGQVSSSLAASARTAAQGLTHSTLNTNMAAVKSADAALAGAAVPSASSLSSPVVRQVAQVYDSKIRQTVVFSGMPNPSSYTVGHQAAPPRPGSRPCCPQ